MSEKKWYTVSQFIIWLLIVPPGILYFLSNQMPEELNLLYFFLFVIFSVLTALLPIKLKGDPITLLMWVTIPAFLLYGIAIEMIAMQFASIASLFVSKGNLQSKIQRFFINSIMMFILSIISAGAFYLVGGQIGSMDFWSLLIAVSVYRLIHTTANIGFINFYLQLRGLKNPFTKKDIGYEYSTIVLILPLALTFYFLLNLIGASAFLLIGTPFFLTIFFIRLYGRSEKVNDLIKRTGEIGSSLSVLTDVDKVTEQFIAKTRELFYADTVFLFNNHDQWLELDKIHEKSRLANRNSSSIRLSEGIARMVLTTNEPVIYTKRNDFKQFSTVSVPDEIESVLCIPLTHNNKTGGILLLGSNRKSAFKDYQLKILELLGSYYIVALDKARYVQEALLRSERCALTNLYNYRYLEERLHYEMDRMEKRDIDDLSVVMLDIDRFKVVNDTYGHQSGNDILKGLAEVLKDALPENGTVGRYGGEEFIFLLPGFSKTDALKFAEQIRNTIKEHPFIIIPDLSPDKHEIVVNITTSIGVTSAPFDGDEAMALLRNADRALYIGAKQAGRDRVAAYAR
ncbi:sensor domain-containing diguanylate cyclase [Sporosarcina highlanderae]|uniref:Sensor domain-containing diguanylate cyclase n=1 Tax=Sporosarcina highlanderae TaxID=3035916 RepID=A0ABT8JPS4_9BACL|nr:sensor domain-containing diguanylate cyclase [Sporosarcina highlanderae]MDN4607146.1 sensor domain-containing diguanylate cyclase [Sporosarcina highlanderae]